MIILASQSPRRKEILTEILGEDNFKCIPSSFDEKQIKEKNIRKLCLEEALGKAKVVSSAYKDDIIISSDTMVSFDNKQLGKPKDIEDAKNMLRMLSGNTHEIITSYVIMKNLEVLKSEVCTAKLYIEKLSEYEIDEYIKSGSPFDKAGAYGVQDKEYINSRIVAGDKYIIMGLPKYELEDSLYELKIIK